MNPDIAQLDQQIKNYTISNLDELESFRLQFLSKKGSIQELFKLMGTVPNQEKATYGKSLNKLKKLAQDTFNQAKIAQHSTQTSLISEIEDISLSPEPLPVGSIHPL